MAGAVAPWGPAARFREGLVRIGLTTGDLVSTSLRSLADTGGVGLGGRGRLNGPPPAGAQPVLASLNAFSCTDMGHDDGDAIAEDLARAEWLRTVRRLDLSGLQIDYAAAEQLFGSPHLSASSS